MQIDKIEKNQITTTTNTNNHTFNIVIPDAFEDAIELSLEKGRFERKIAFALTVKNALTWKKWSMASDELLEALMKTQGESWAVMRKIDQLIPGFEIVIFFLGNTNLTPIGHARNSLGQIEEH